MTPTYLVLKGQTDGLDGIFWKELLSTDSIDAAVGFREGELEMRGGKVIIVEALDVRDAYRQAASKSYVALEEKVAAKEGPKRGW